MKETIIQFGEGGFLRSFADVFVHKMNEQGLYDGKVVVVQPIAKGLIPVLNEQKGVYHQFLRGIEEGEVVNDCIKVTSISRGLIPPRPALSIWARKVLRMHRLNLSLQSLRCFYMKDLSWDFPDSLFCPVN